MKENKELRINHLPAYTWYFLGMNYAGTKAIEKAVPGQIEEEMPEGFEKGTGGLSSILNIETGSGREVDEMLQKAGVTPVSYQTKKAVQLKDALRLRFSLSDQALHAIHLEAKEASKSIVVMDFTSEMDAPVRAAVQTKISIEKDAVLHLVQITRVGQQCEFINDVGAVAADGGRLEVTHLHLSGEKNWQGLRVDLKGTKSSFACNIGYAAFGDHLLDMNYIVNHIGRKTNSDMNISGVLRDRAQKIFRGTIDLRHGATGAEGNEKEDVLLMDEAVRNRTIPIILCTEEDVVGNHGATIGRIDEDLLFYLESRGISKEEIYEMMAAARIHAIADRIPDERTREEVLSFARQIR